MTDRRRGTERGRRRRTDDGSLALGFHAVRTALESRPGRVERLLLARGRRDDRTRRIVALAREAGVPFRQVPRDALDRLAEGLPHQGIAARLAAVDLAGEAEMIDRIDATSVVVVLDGVSDPRNVGAIARSAAAFGASGLFLPAHRGAGLGPGAARTAAGALDLLPVSRAGNVSRLVEALGRAGLATAALVAEGGRPPWEVDLSGGLALVAGSEEKGIRPSVARRCDHLLTLPIRAEVGSLNVSVAVGALLAEVARQRLSVSPPGEPDAAPSGRR